jgi:hypothetical protein
MKKYRDRIIVPVAVVVVAAAAALRERTLAYTQKMYFGRNAIQQDVSDLLDGETLVGCWSACRR